MRRFLPDADVMDPVEISEDELSGDLKAKIDQEMCIRDRFGISLFLGS